MRLCRCSPGFDVVSQLREKAVDYQPAIFIVTAVYKSRRWESEARLQYKVDEYLEKPLEPEDLVKADWASLPRVPRAPRRPASDKQ